MPSDTAAAIRTATLTDVPEVTKLINLAFRVEDFFIDGNRTHDAEVRELLQSGSFLVAENEGAMVGAIYLKLAQSRGYFGLLSIDPKQQRSGLGRLLISAVEKLAREQGATHMDIRIVNLRTDLFSYYRALGYSESGESAFEELWKLRMPAHFVHMTKPLV